MHRDVLIQTIVSRTENYTTQETRTGTRSDGAGGTESYTYTEDVQQTRIVNDVVFEEVPDPVPASDQLVLEEELAFDDEGEGEVEPMTPEEAIEILDENFSDFDTAAGGWWADGKVSTRDLEAVAENADGDFTDEQQQAAQTLLDSPTYLNFVDTAAGNGSVDGVIGRNDVEAALETIATGEYLDELLDTAGGMGSRDDFVGNADVRAFLADPSVPQAMKDTLELILDSTEGGDDLYAVVADLSAAEVEAIGELAQTPEFAGLSEDERQLVADAIRDSGGDATVIADVRTLIESADFSAGTTDERIEGLSEIALLNSTEFAALPATDQALIRNALTDATAAGQAVASELLALVQHEDFALLTADQQTAVLSQAKNYPDERSIDNLARLVSKDWFRSMSLADTQRSAKVIAFISQHPGDRTIIDNTLDRFLDDGASYSFDWSQSGTAYGSAGGDTFRFNRIYLPDGNDPVDTTNDDTFHMVTHTVAHEVNHLVNGDTVAQSFDYFMAEYRAFYVGFRAQNGRDPTRAEVLDRVRGLLTSTTGAYNSIRLALADPVEGPRFIPFLEEVLGRVGTAGTPDEVTQANAGSLPALDPNVTAPAPTDGGDMDN